MAGNISQGPGGLSGESTGMRNRAGMGLVAVILFVAVLSGCGGKPAAKETPIIPDMQVANADRPGEAIALSALLVPGKTTLVEFYSVHCEHSPKMVPVLELLAAKQANLAIRQVNIDRRTATDIDFDSPVAEQFAVKKVPSFRIYDENCQLKAEGDAAKDEVKAWYAQAQMFDRAESDPATKKIMERYEKQ